jgi:hypothetical protein
LAQSRTRRRAYPEGGWPTEAQRLLLRASLLDGDAGREAWGAWRAAHDLEALDPGSFRLLGLLYRNLGRLGVTDDPHLPRLKGVYRYFWSRHQVVFAGRPALLAAFHARQIPTMVLKGAALALSVYRDPGVRPMEDFDLLVHRSQALQAMAVLRSEGLRPVVPNHESLVDVAHACLFEQDHERAVDLHWRLLATDSRPGADDRFWADARPLLVGGAPTLSLSPADQLLHTAEHGVRYDPVPPLRWLADATLIIRTAGSGLDWDRLARESVARGLVLPVRETLEYLRDELGVSVPAEILGALAAARVPWLERVAHDLAQRPSAARAEMRVPLALQLTAYARRCRGAGLVRSLRELPGYLRAANGIHGSLIRHAWDAAARAPWSLARRWRRDRRPTPDVPVRLARGFHQPEQRRGRSFRWSRPSAAVRCQLPPGPYTARLDLGGLREWQGDLERSLAIWFNDTPIPPALIDPVDGALSFPLDAEAFLPRPWQVLRWTCAPRPEGVDPRPLGLPVFGLRFDPLSSRPSLHGCHPPERWGGRTFRWSRPRALLRWRLPPSPCVVRLDLGGLRPWAGDLDRSLALRLDGTPVPPAAIRPSPEGVVLTLGRAMFGPGPARALELECTPAPAPGDSRALGLPIFGIAIDPAAPGSVGPDAE